ncbi:hypothetical protein OGAPHI_006099 [Ogataea philodendri]|uniref:Uncharacterized protein n=1 Tax=Ogataea philodendri TaxID=1378263 RepID=A0A9P8NY58_9ASCO|nr:uncharacterized protein OGAPHI_006099 [Ogataea philodendri]KAH3661920.1 hypothetical protein OGAPHI_006099 [Ogataea philodendri]
MLNLSATLQFWKIVANPSLVNPSLVVPTFQHLPVLPHIRGMVLDKDNCIAEDHDDKIWPAYEEKWALLRKQYPDTLLIVSNSAGTDDDTSGQAARLQQNTGVPVLRHSTKKPGCWPEIEQWFRARGVLPHEVAVVGDRLFTDIFMANQMGAYGVWPDSLPPPMAPRTNISAFRVMLEASAGPTEIRPARIHEVANWDAIFSNPKMFSSMLIYVAFMMAQLGLSYAGFVYFEVENRPAIYSVSLLYNIFASYFFPILIASAMEENLESPFESLRREVKACQGFVLCICVQAVALALSVWSTVRIFQTDQVMLIDYDYLTRRANKIDVTSMIKVFQVVSLTLTGFGFLMSLVNFWITRNRLIRFLHRIEREHQLANDNLADDFYERCIKTTRRKNVQRAVGKRVRVRLAARNLVRQHLGRPHAAGALVDVDLLRLSRVDAQHVRHEYKRSILRRELFAEQPELLEPCVVRHEVVLHHGARHQHRLNRRQDLRLDAQQVWFRQPWVVRCVQLLDRVCKRLVLVLVILAAVVFVDTQHVDVVLAVAHDPDVWTQRNGNRQRQLDVASSSLHILGQSVVEDAEQLEDPLLATTVSGGWELHRKRMQAAVVATDGDPLVARGRTPDKLQCRQEPLDLDKVVVGLLVEQVLARNLDLLELLVVELAQVRTNPFQVHLAEISIQLLLQEVLPFAQLADIRLKVWLALDDVLVELLADVFRLRIRLGDPDQHMTSESGLAVRQRREQLRNERDPVPDRHVSLVRLERLCERAVGVVQTDEPQDTAQQSASLAVLVQAGGLQVAADGVLGVRDVVVLLEPGIVEESPLGPGLRQFRKEHSLQRDELGLLLCSKVYQVGVADNVQSRAQLGWVLVMALGLFPELQEGLLDLNVWKSVDLGQLVDTDLWHIVFSSNVSKSVDHPRNLVVASESVRVVVGVVLLQSRNQRHVHLVDHVERMLSPGNQIVPDIDIVPDVWQPFSPCLQDSLEFLALDVQVLGGGSCQTSVNLAGFHKLNVLLENV